MLSLLESCRLTKASANYNSWTHTSLGGYIPIASFRIEGDDHNKLIEYYCTEVVSGRNKLCLSERHLPEYSPLLVDIDMRWEFNAVETMDRQFDIKFIVSLASLYVQNLLLCTDTSTLPPVIRCFVLEKPKPVPYKGKKKDGFHLHFPEVWMDHQALYHIRQLVINDAKKSQLFKHLNLCTDLENIIDEAVISRNNWLMYGSSKYDMNTMVSSTYKVTHVLHFTFDLNIVDTAQSINTDIISDVGYFQTQVGIRELIRDLSIRRTDVKLARLNDKHIELAPKKQIKDIKVSADPNLKKKPQIQDEQLLNDVRILIGMLPEMFYEDYNYWSRVGWCLKNINPSLRDLFHEFSSQSPKYSLEECDRFWFKDTSSVTGELNYGSLVYWVKQNNSSIYNNWITERKVEMMKNFQMTRKEVTIAHFDIAVILKKLYGDVYVCSETEKGGIWYKFNGIRWQLDKKAGFLSTIISTELYQDILRVAQHYSQQAINSTDDDMMRLKSELFIKYASKLKNNAFKQSIINECLIQFYDSKFADSLNRNKMLLGFENGILDLENFEFRKGYPDDRITFSTGIDFVNHINTDFMDEETITLDDEERDNKKKIMDVLCQILPSKEVRDYFLTRLGSCLEGGNMFQDFNIMTGKGANGKSTLINIIKHTFGDYYYSLAVSVLTEKSASSEKATPALNDCKGRRIITCQEPQKNSTINASLLKQLTGADTITSRKLFENTESFVIEAKFFMMCNDLPNVDAEDGGLWRRIKVIPFVSRFVDGEPSKPNEFRKNKDLEMEIKKYASTFMSILLWYYKNKFKNNESITAPPEVTAVTDKYKRDHDMYRDFIEERLLYCPGQSIEDKDVYTVFKVWMKENHSDSKAPAKREFLNSMIKIIDTYDSSSKFFEDYKFKDDVTTNETDF